MLDADEIACGGNALDPQRRPERVDSIFAGVDDDGDLAVDEALPAGASGADCDGDGAKGSAENHVYAYKVALNGDQKVCGLYDTAFPDAGQTASPSLGWPIDFVQGGIPNSTLKVTVTDLTSFLAPVRYLGTNTGARPGDVRWDVTPGKGLFSTDINVSDLTALIAGGTGSPPMLGGTMAFNGPSCPWPPSP